MLLNELLLLVVVSDVDYKVVLQWLVRLPGVTLLILMHLLGIFILALIVAIAGCAL